MTEVGMGRIIMAAMLAALIAQPASAQIGFKAGLSFASTTESEFIPDVDTRTGFAAGISLGLPLGSSLRLQPELLYVEKGGKFANDQTLEINELNVPVLLRFNMPLPAIAPFVLAGPVAEYELTCKAADVDCVDTESLRWGFMAGAGVRRGGGLSVEARYGYTLSEISDNIKSKPRAILLLIGLGG
jgi:hypothetical protein